MELELNQLKQDKSKILTSLHNLENRYKNILDENKAIKQELLDFRKNRPVIAKIVSENAFNMPLSKS